MNILYTAKPSVRIFLLQLCTLVLQPWHMSAAALNAFHNIWLKQATDDEELTLYVNNHPLPRTAEAEVCNSACVYRYVFVCVMMCIYDESLGIF